MIPEFYVDSGGITNGICYGLCECNVWPVAYDARFPYYATNFHRCGRCGVKPDLLDPYMFNTKEAALEIFYENYNRYPEPFGES